MKIFTSILLLLFPAPLLFSQEEPTHTITEIKSLLNKTSEDSVRINLLVEAAVVYVWKPGMEKNDFDSALYFVNQAMNLSSARKEPVWQARCFNALSQLYREGGQKEKGRKYIDSAIVLFTKHDRKKELAHANMELQNYYDIFADNEYADKIKFTEEAARLYGESGDKQTQAGVLKHLGDFYQLRGMDTLALKHLHDALDIYKSLQYEKVQGTYDLIGYVLFGRGDYHQALKYGLLAVQTAEKYKTGLQELSTIYNRLGLTYYRLVQYKEATESFTHAFSLALNNKDTANARAIAPNVIDIYLRQRNQREAINYLQATRFMYDMPALDYKEYFLSSSISAHLLTGDHKKAEPFVHQLYGLVNDNSETRRRRMLNKAVIPYYLAAGEFKKMYRHLPDNEKICLDNKIISGLADNYLWWYKADSALGNHSDAMAHFKMYKEASDSSLRLTANQQINALLIQHETNKKDQELAVKESNIELLTNQSNLQKEQLRITRLVRNLTYGLAALLLLVAGLLYNRYRLKQRSNKKLEQLLVEKKWLLQEVHHRVKNNMQIVMSLLNLQSANTENETALSAIRDSENRMHAMSLIHQKLYNTENVTSIDMSVYIHELVSNLNDSFNAGQRIRFELDIEHIEMDVSQVVPLGLILNEAITNAIKYVFQGGKKGVISISLSEEGPHHCLLVVSDNGIGISPDDMIEKPGSLGMSLMAGLSEDLNGNFSIENDNGTTIKISFISSPAFKQPALAATLKQ